MSDQIVPSKVTARTKNFWIPIRLMQNDGIFKLSHHALKLYLHLAYKLYRKQIHSLLITNSEASRLLNIPRHVMSVIRRELVSAGLIEFVPDSRSSIYQFVSDVPVRTNIDIAHDSRS
jgi:hypothetical protein